MREDDGLLEEGLLHGRPGAQQEHRTIAPTNDLVAYHVHDAHERNGRAIHKLLEHDVSRYAAKRSHVTARRCQMFDAAHEVVRQLVQAPLGRQGHDIVTTHAFDGQRRKVVSAHTPADTLGDTQVVVNRGFGTHASDETKLVHMPLLSPAVGTRPVPVRPIIVECNR